MEERGNYDFCPRCGAVMQNGSCPGCGYQKKSFRGPAGEQHSGRRPKRSAGGKLVLGIILGGASLLMLLVVLIVVFSFGAAVGSASLVPYGGGELIPYYEYPEGYGDYGEEPYVPSPEDDYYTELADATASDLSYAVQWETVSVQPDQEEDYCTYYSIFPVLTGEKEAVLMAANEKIREEACAYRSSYRDYEGGASSYAYVTFMDEEKLSVAVQHTLYEHGRERTVLHSVNFRMDTGEILSGEEILPIDEELVRQFRSRNSLQNGEVEFLQEASDEELLELLRNEESRILFYTPVGLEIGFNFEDGWVTVTLKSRIL